MSAADEIIHDDRRKATGWPRILFLGLLLAAVIFLWRAIIAATDSLSRGDGVEMIGTLVAAAAWTLGAIGALHNGRRMRWVAGACWIINIVLPFVGVGFPDLFDPVNPWYRGGATYFYLPTLGAILALVWLMWSRPANLNNMREVA